MAKSGYKATEEAIDAGLEAGKKLLSEISRTSRTRTHISDIAAALISRFGNADGYANEFYATYLAVKESKSVTQQVALLKTVGNMIQIDTEINGRGTPTQDMPNEDIDYELEELLHIGKEAIEAEGQHAPMESMSMEEIAKQQPSSEAKIDRRHSPNAIDQDDEDDKARVFDEDDDI